MNRLFIAALILMLYLLEITHPIFAADPYVAVSQDYLIKLCRKIPIAELNQNFEKGLQSIIRYND